MALFHNNFHQLPSSSHCLPLSFPLSAHTGREAIRLQRCASAQYSLPHPHRVCALSTSLLPSTVFCISVFCRFLCVSLHGGFPPPPRPETRGSCWPPSYLVLLDHPVLLVLGRRLPGDHDSGPIVPALHHCNIPGRGTGGWGGGQTKDFFSFFLFFFLNTHTPSYNIQCFFS